MSDFAPFLNIIRYATENQSSNESPDYTFLRNQMLSLFDQGMPYDWMVAYQGLRVRLYIRLNELNKNTEFRFSGTQLQLIGFQKYRQIRAKYTFVEDCY